MMVDLIIILCAVNEQIKDNLIKLIKFNKIIHVYQAECIYALELPLDYSYFVLLDYY